MSLDLVFEKLDAMGRGFLRHLPNLVIGILLLVITWLVATFLSRMIVRALARSRLRRSLQDLFSKIVAAVFWIVGLLASATVVFPNLNVDEIVTLLGISSVAVGFAFKDVFENFMAGIVILLRSTLEIGDFVRVQGIVGRVEQISIRDTHIKTTDGRRVVLPNAMLFKNPVEILTDEDVRRVTVTCGVAYDVDVDEAREVIREAVAACDSVRDGHPVEIFAREFASSSIDFEVSWWTGARPLDIRTSRDEVVAAVKRALDEAGIEIPFPYRTLTFKEPLPLRRED